MPQNAQPADDDLPSRAASYYRDFVAEREEVLRHKWFMSERAGHDVGLEAALLSWVDNHHAPWRRQRSGRRQPEGGSG